MRLASLLRMGSPSSTAVETRGRAAKCALSTTKTGGGAAACRTGGVVGCAGAVALWVVVDAEDVAVVGCAAGFVGENGVGFGYEGENVGG